MKYGFKRNVTLFFFFVLIRLDLILKKLGHNIRQYVDFSCKIISLDCIVNLPSISCLEY